jgi:hypothetical protein
MFVRPSVRIENSAPTRRIFMKFGIWLFFGGKKPRETSSFVKIGQE